MTGALVRSETVSSAYLASHGTPGARPELLSLLSGSIDDVQRTGTVSMQNQPFALNAVGPHTGPIVIDPRDSTVVFVAAYGSLWKEGGERGLYKTADGGATWNKVLEISENTGIGDVALDPNNPDMMLAVAHQRRRHTWTLIHGGPVEVDNAQLALMSANWRISDSFVGCRLFASVFRFCQCNDTRPERLFGEIEIPHSGVPKDVAWRRLVRNDQAQESTGPIKRSARSISDPRRTALVVHGERCDPCRPFSVRPFPQGCHQSLNSLAMVQFALPVFVESSSITIPF